MEKDILTIMNLSGCMEDEARNAYNQKNGDVLLSVDYIMFGDSPPPALNRRKREDINEHEEYLNSMRKTMEAIDGNIAEHRSTTSNPLAPVELTETQDHHEEMVPQSSYFQECQISEIE